MSIFNAMAQAASAGGLEYEEGTWSSSTAEVNHTVTFSNTHTSRPIFAMAYTNGNTSNTTNGSFVINFYDYKGLKSSSVYGLTIACRSSGTVSRLTTATSESTLNGVVNTSRVVFSAISSSYPFSTSQTFYWIAIWAPEN